MNKSISYISIVISVFLILTALTSVIGYSSLQSQNSQEKSPLFAVRTARYSNEPSLTTIQSEYLGKGKNTNLFPESYKSFQSYINTVVKILLNNPSLAKKLFEILSGSPQVNDILATHGFRMSEIKGYLSQLTNNPELEAQLKGIDGLQGIADIPQPRGLSTSSIIGCFVVVLALLPLAIVIGIVVSTMLIVTCLNIDGCADTIIKAILIGIIQEIKEP